MVEKEEEEYDEDEEDRRDGTTSHRPGVGEVTAGLKSGTACPPATR